MKVVVFGLSLSSSWGNGHATTWRALLQACAKRDHDILFLERDLPWYAANRDLVRPAFCRLALYGSLGELRRWADEVRSADAVIVGSYTPDGIAVGTWVQQTAAGIVAFYDIDTPVTLGQLERGAGEYISPELIGRYDLYLSFTGGPTLQRLETRYGSPAARALYCSVDADAYRPLSLRKRWDLSYLATYSADRQPALERLLIEPARRAPDLSFVVAGPQYPETITWPDNVERLDHVAPADHTSFYGSSRYTLNITRSDMIVAGYSPSVRLFEAAACGVPILSDTWPGLASLLQPGREILVPPDSDSVVGILSQVSEADRMAIADRARACILARHTAMHRAAELEAHLREAIAHKRARRSDEP